MVEAPVVSQPPCNSVFVTVTISAVSRIVMKSSTKACAPDPMPTWLLKELLLSIAPLMTDFINSSLQPGVVPDSMKSAAVTQLLKKPSLDINILKNYRPVSNLPFVSKVLERVMASQLKAYMDYNDLHDPLQSAGQFPPLLCPPGLSPGSATLPHLHSPTPSPDTISWAAGAWICR